MYEQRADGYYWVRLHTGETLEIARWGRNQWWFSATHMAVQAPEVVVLSERLVPPDVPMP